MSTFDLRGDERVALVTGGASGLGLAFAEKFGEAGYAVAMLDVDEAAGQEQAERLRTSGIDALFVRTDVGDEAHVVAAVEAVIERWGRLDVVINNAGISGPEALTQDLEVADFENVLRIDLGGPFRVSKHAIRAMQTRGGGSIINIASITAEMGAPIYPAYGAAKAGVISLTRSLARHTGRLNIRVNCINPGSIKGTRLLESGRGRALSAEEKRNMMMALIQKVPLGRPAQPEDIAHTALFLASPLAKHVHGSVVTVDGGESLA